ncbi:MAG: transcription termination/antitermination protein NusG [Candidatus Zixiibacteriota bacterium]|jgi:transcriptional antiterminator NusG
MALRWYVVHTYSGHEQKAKRYLESAVENSGLKEMFGRILIPTEQVTEMKQGKRSTSTKKFLPSYILVEMELNRETQNLVVSTPSVTNFVGAAGKPHPLKEDEVERIIGQIDRSRTAEVSDVPYQAGDAVKVIDGPFADFSGFVSEINMERKKIKVMVSIFGRPTPVELDYLQVESVKQK